MNGLSTLAYIDAGSGSYLLAAIAAGASGVWFFVRSKWASLTNRGTKADAVETTEAVVEQSADEKA